MIEATRVTNEETTQVTAQEAAEEAIIEATRVTNDETTEVTAQEAAQEAIIEATKVTNEETTEVTEEPVNQEETQIVKDVQVAQGEVVVDNQEIEIESSMFI